MQVRIVRAIEILFHLFKKHKLALLIQTIGSTLFRNDLLNVYAISADLLIKDNSDYILQKEGGVESVLVKKGNIEELDDFCRRKGASAWEFRCHHYDGVKDFFIARDADTIQCITWIYVRADKNRFLVLGENDALLQYGLTLPKFRGNGIYPEVQRAAVRYLLERGYHKVFVLVDQNNSASARSQEKVGFVKISQIRMIKIFGMQVSRKLDVSKLQLR